MRQQVLEDQNWIIHRIWSTDWLQRPEEQTEKTLAAIEDAKAVWAGRSEEADPAPPQPSVNEQPAVDRHEPEAMSAEEPQRTAAETDPYLEADFQVNAPGEIHTLTPGQLARVVTKIVEIEGPVHQDEIARRTATLWGLQRTGRRIADAVDAALNEAEHQGQVERDGLFFTAADQTAIPIRNRESVQSANLRKPDYLPPAEVRAAIVEVVKANFGVPRDKIAPEVALLFGFRSTSKQLRKLVEEEIEVLQQQGQLEPKNENVYVAAETDTRV